jgi:hypothetical protein
MGGVIEAIPLLVLQLDLSLKARGPVTTVLSLTMQLTSLGKPTLAPSCSKVKMNDFVSDHAGIGCAVLFEARELNSSCMHSLSLKVTHETLASTQVLSELSWW